MTRSSETRAFLNTKVGDALPTLTIPLSATGIAAAAIATRDYQPIHHDLGKAQSLGNANVLMNTHTTAGYLERMVVEWAGRDVFLRKVAFRMGVPNYAGDTMVLTGRVIAAHEETRCVDVEIVGANSLGNHVVGTVTAQLP